MSCIRTAEGPKLDDRSGPGLMIELKCDTRPTSPSHRISAANRANGRESGELSGSPSVFQRNRARGGDLG